MSDVDLGYAIARKARGVPRAAPDIGHEPPEWTYAALCAQVDPEIFHPGKGGTTRPAKRVCCAECPVREPCLRMAFERPRCWERRMSKGARLRAERARQRNPLLTPWSFPRPGEEIETALMPGATIDTDEAVKAMQKQTHDGLIRMLGPRRRSGIRWHHVHGAADANRFLTDLYGDRPDDGVDQYRAFLDEYGDQAVLVIAACEAVR